jgi:hypothetical protein
MTAAAYSPSSGSGSTTSRPLGDTITVSRTDAYDGRARTSTPSASKWRSAPVVRPSPHVLSRGKRALSTASASSPRRFASHAAAAPAGPAPTTRTSTRSGRLTARRYRPFNGSLAARGDTPLADARCRLPAHLRLEPRWSPRQESPLPGAAVSLRPTDISGRLPGSGSGRRSGGEATPNAWEHST